MKIHRLYLNDYKEQREYTLKSKGAIYHLGKVLKIRAGEQITIFNGLTPIDYLCNVSHINNKEARFTLVNSIEKVVVFKKNINLYFAITKSGVEEILRACTEIGAASFYPIITDRTEKKELNMERMQKIIIEACEQSDRNDLPVLHKVIRLKDITPLPMNSVVYHTKNADPSPNPPQGRELDTSALSPSLGEGASKLQAEMAEGVVSIFIGPEGGFTDGEIENLTRDGAAIKNLSTYTLRTVTAAPICLFDAMAAD